MKWLLVAAPLVAGCLSFHSGPMEGEPKAASFANVGDARVRYIDVGSGPPVVLIHGFASSLEAWATVVPELQKNHRVIAMDLKGFGWSDRPAGDYSPSAEAQLVLDLLTQRGVDKADIVAHSWGASVALSLALAAPGRVNRIALYDAWVYEEQLPTFFVMSRARGVGETLFSLFYEERPDEKLALGFFDKTLVSEKLAEDVERAMDRPGTVAAALAAVRGQRYAEVQKSYGRIEQPVLLLWGRDDVVTPPTFGERLSHDLPHARLVVYPRCGHFPMIEARSASNDELTRFLGPGNPPAVNAPAPPSTPDRTKREAPPTAGQPDADRPELTP